MSKFPTAGGSVKSSLLQVTENTIIDLPTAVATFHMDLHEPRIPAIAVASGSHIYIYKELLTFPITKYINT
jgi:hypothetical protein